MIESLNKLSSSKDDLEVALGWAKWTTKGETSDNMRGHLVITIKKITLRETVAHGGLLLRGRGHVLRTG